MTRFVTKLAAATAAVALASVPGLASAQTTQAVDEKTGPVSFANVASIRIGNPGSLITETQRSPLTPGQSKLSPDRTVVPRDAGEKSTFGDKWDINLGRFGADSPYPAGVASRDHNVIAALQQTTVPTAVAESNYALIDNGRGGAKPADNTVLVLEGAKSTVDCSAPGKATSSTSVEKVWVREANGALRPAGASGVDVKGLKLGPPSGVKSENSDKDKTTSDLTLSRVTAFDQLIRQDGWRSGDVTAVAGWKLDIVTHVRDAAGKDLREARTTIVLGGVSCGIPKNFVAKPAGGTGPGAAPEQPAVPGTVPAGGIPPQADDSTRTVVGLGLLGGGIVIGAAALLLFRRRTSVPVREK
ncbi:hypothetical protein [Amycolatopsis azurea]|uniref:Secreted protein n=1 Tax=Amycolatopsis azurea DSM 43854 TaxID=1238180 RepID=M2NUU9_9PSEU|nr:hypothetical protein [Amycolatopsis azurea]EMD26294.1 hypothetical protein C791_3842 [Amycolatopsis azurea DSM 43854]OOC01530.1 hypothetical protein B0293_38745 [Amycolatopsis azurea DSM 43854]